MYTFSPSLPYFFITFFTILLTCVNASAAPTGDAYLASAQEIVDTYENVPLVFDGVAQDIITDFDLTRVNERFLPFNGIPSGPLVTFADGTTGRATAWQNSGHVVEFRITSTDEGFISFTPNAPVFIEFKDINLNASGPSGANPQAIGFYFDFNHIGSELAYNFGSFLFGEPYAVGDHPLQAGNKVVYFTSTGAAFNSSQFAQVVSGKLNVLFSSFAQFQNAPVRHMMQANGLGLTPNVNMPPFINEMLIGVLITGLPASLQGDFDGDGDVDGNDFLAWQRGLGKPNANPSDGDADGDRDVDGSDLGVWKDQFGDSAGSGTSAIVAEEPGYVEYIPEEPKLVEAEGLPQSKIFPEVSTPKKFNKKKQKKKSNKIMRKKEAKFKKIAKNKNLKMQEL